MTPDPNGVFWFSYSQLQSFANCEAQWAYRYAQGWKAQAPSRGLSLGTAMHRAFGAWWRGDSPYDAIGEWVGTDEAQRLNEMVRMSIVDDAKWLMERYAKMYEKDREWVTVKEQELRFKVELPVPPDLRQMYGDALPKYGLVVVIDQLAFDQRSGLDLLWEFKTSNQWGREDWLEADPQVTTYLWSCSVAGIKVDMAIFDLAKTYRWKKDDRPVADSFRRFFISRDKAELQTFAYNAYRACLAAHQAEVRGWYMRNISQSCTSCAYCDPCLEHLKGDLRSEQAILEESFLRRKR